MDHDRYRKTSVDSMHAGLLTISRTQVSFYTFITPLASSMMAPGLPQIAEHYGITNETITALTLSIFLLTFAIGPLIFGPLSEMYGRTWVYHIANLLFLAFNLGCAFSDTVGILLGFRLLGEDSQAIHQVRCR